jgi:glycosyltransferase involved in cell wall biosynthesis
VAFQFIKYTQPAWYFNTLPRADGIIPTATYHPALLPLPDGIQFNADNSFETEAARNKDIGYRAWHNGFLLKGDKQVVEEINKMSTVSLTDEYRFITKYWGSKWSLFALVVRLLSFKNPFQEIIAFNKGKRIKQTDLYNGLYNWSAYHSFQSTLIQSQPFVTVVIPTLNRYEYLKNVLEDLEKQSYKNFEVTVVDQSENFNAQFYEGYDLKLNIIHQQAKELWTARNRAIKESKADYLLFYDDDSRIDEDWIEHHLKCIDFFKCDISAGVSISTIGGKVSNSYNHFRWADQFDSGNAMVKRSVFKSIGLFDLQFNKQSMGDSEFGIRAYTNGFKSISNPYAKRLHLKANAGGLREIGHWDGFRPKKLFAPKPLPSVVYLYKKYYPEAYYRNAVYLGILLSNTSYKNKRSGKMLLKSVLLTAFKLPLLTIQFRRSLSRANAMLKEGNKIEWLP